MYSNAYFIAQGRSLEIIVQFEAQVRAHVKHWHAVRKEIGAQGIYQAGASRAVGFGFAKDVTPPACFVAYSRKQKHILVPSSSKKSAEGRAFWTRLSEHPHPGGGLCERLFPEVGILGIVLGPDPRSGALRVSGVGAEPIGADWIIVVPIGETETTLIPPDALPIKPSDYWARKEAAEAAKQPSAEASA